MNVKVALLVTILLAACSQHDAPSEKVEKAAEDVVSAVDGQSEAQLPGPFAPRDDCTRLPEAPIFLRTLNEAVAKHDTDTLVALAADDIKLDFGGGSGIAQLRARLDAKDGKLWDELGQLDQLGCAVNSQGGLTLPWFAEQPIPFDATNGFIVSGTNVPVYNGPATDAPIVARLSWDAVRALPDGTDHDNFLHVILPPSETAPRSDEPVKGYIARDRLRSLLDYRLTAASRNGRWRIISLLAGD